MPKHPVKKNLPRSSNKLPSAWVLTKKTARIIWSNKKLFIALTLIYAILNIVLVNGLASAPDIASLKAELSQVFTGTYGSLASSVSVLVVLLGGSGSNAGSAGGYQLFVTLVISLAAIWALRQIMAGHRTIRIRDTFYLGMYPLVPFVLVLLVIGLQLIPLIIGSSLLNLVIGSGIAVSGAETIIWYSLFALLAGVTLYFLTSSLLALYIVTLPDMTPLKALRSAKELVIGRRLSTLRKILWLPLLLLIGVTIIMLPVILWLTVLAQIIFFLLSMFVLLAIHAYMYTLYRELLNE